MPWGTANASSVSSYTLSDSKPCKPPVIQYYAGVCTLDVNVVAGKKIVQVSLLPNGTPRLFTKQNKIDIVKFIEVFVCFCFVVC